MRQRPNKVKQQEKNQHCKGVRNFGGKMPINSYNEPGWSFGSYKISSPPPQPSLREQYLVNAYRELTIIAEFIHGGSYHGNREKVEQTIHALAMIDLKRAIKQMPRNTEKIVERVVVGDPINQIMNEIYKP